MAFGFRKDKLEIEVCPVQRVIQCLEKKKEKKIKEEKKNEFD